MHPSDSGQEEYNEEEKRAVCGRSTHHLDSLMNVAHPHDTAYHPMQGAGPDKPPLIFPNAARRDLLYLKCRRTQNARWSYCWPRRFPFGSLHVGAERTPSGAAPE